MKSKNKSLEKKIDVLYCKCGHPVTFHAYDFKTEKISYCNECDCKQYSFDKIVKKKVGDCLGYYDGKWMTFYEIRKIEENKG